MLTKMEDVPANVAGFTATGIVDKNDYDTVLVPALEKMDKEHGHLHFIMVLKTPVKNFSLTAWLKDAWIGLKHFKGWKRIAIVTNEHFIETFSNTVGVLIPGKTKGFSLAELEEAKTWVAIEED